MMTDDVISSDAGARNPLQQPLTRKVRGDFSSQALHEIVVALEPRFFLNMRPTKASMGSQLGNMLTIVAKTWVLYPVPRFNNVGLPF